MWRFGVGGESRRFGARCSGPGDASDRRGSWLFIVRIDNSYGLEKLKEKRRIKNSTIAKNRDLASFYVILRRT